MSETSRWPLAGSAQRILTPHFLLRLLQSDAASADCYPVAMGYYPSAKNHRMERAADEHDDYLMIYCSAGRGVVTAAGVSIAITAGQVVLLEPRVAHSYAADKDEPWSIYWCHFEGAHAAEYHARLAPEPAVPAVITLPSQHEFKQHFESLLQVQRTGYKLAVFIHAATLVRQMLAWLAVAKDLRGNHRRGGVDISAVEAYMRENIGRSLSLDELAAEFRLSKFHFASQYREQAGYPPIKHFLHMKMEYACDLLNQSSMSVQQVSRELGYDDPLYFSRLFKKTTGFSPRAYRLRYQ